MYAIYKQKKYDAELRLGKDVTLYSYVKEEGFENHVDPWGRESDDFFSKKMDIHELDYLYRIDYEIQYKGHFYIFKNGDFTKRAIAEEAFYILSDDVSNPKFFENLGFTQSDKFYFDKKISRSDIEAIKIIEKPLGIFKDQGLKIKIIEGKDIDDFLASVKD